VATFLEQLREGALIADGGMGSMIHQFISEPVRCTDEVNLTRPDVVMAIHGRFLAAGVDIIETNTFGANRVQLGRFGLENDVARVNGRAVKLARESREIAGRDAFIAGSIGPAGFRTEVDRGLLIDVFREQAVALDDRGVDLFILETFSRVDELTAAVEAVRAVSQLPIVAQVTVPAGDNWSDDGVEIGADELRVLEALAQVPADVIGFNCSVGPSQLLPWVRKLKALAPDRKVAVQPNSGAPRRIRGRYLYPDVTSDYYRAMGDAFVRAGASLVGGCCGTSPDQIAAMAEGARASTPSPTPIVEFKAIPEPTRPVRADGVLRRKLRAGEFVVSMQVDPPKGTSTDMIMDACRAFRDSGHVDVADVNSNPMARLHLDALWMSSMIEREGLETIAHYTPRDASLMGIQGNLLGAWRAGVRNVLAITGDPSVVNGIPGESDVYQTDSVGMVRYIQRLNDGFDCFDNTIGSPPDFEIGVAVNPNAPDLDAEIDRFKAKVDNGATFAMTQVFFEWSCWERFLDRFGGTPPIPCLVAVWPLTSFRLAHRLHHEVPGILVPEDLLAELQAAGSGARKVGFDLGRKMLREAPDRAQGAYIIAPFKRPLAALELFE